VYEWQVEHNDTELACLVDVLVAQVCHSLIGNAVKSSE
jgi:hypothetical protein